MFGENKDKKVVASFMIEILGKPASHIKETLEKLVEKLGEEKGVKILEKTINEPKKYEQKQSEEQKKQIEELKEKAKGDEEILTAQELFTTFAEIEAEFENIEKLVAVVFGYMPSNIEIISPKNLSFDNRYVSELLTGIILRLHKYDEIAKKLMMERNILINKLKEVMGEKN